MWRRRGRAFERESGHLGDALLLDEIALERERSIGRVHHRADAIVAHRQDAAFDPEPARNIGGDGRQGLAVAQPPRPFHMQGKVAISELEPCLAADLGERLHEAPGLVAAAPARLKIVDVRKRIGHGVEIGRDAQAKMLEIVGGVDDNRERRPAAARAQAPAQAWRRRCRRIAQARVRSPSSEQILRQPAG